MTSRQLISVALAALALAAAGCGGEQKDPSAIDGDPTTTLPKELANAGAPAQTQTTPSGPLPKATAVQGVSKDLSKKPAVPKPTGKAPSRLEALDVVAGKGRTVKSGDTVSVDYVGVLFNNGKQFDATDFKGHPFQFKVGQGSVIAGWDQGLPGMKVGGRRVLVIPADLAYGSDGQPPTIPANAPLVFVVDLKKIG
jgi:FKBP-type peptidyl-prolyl cis-trans isomerase